MTNRLKLYAILILVSLILPANLFCRTSSITLEPPSLTLKFNKKEIKLATPIIKQNKTLLFPIRDSLPYLNAEFTYLRKTNAFQLKHSRTTCLLPVNSKEVWVNQVQHFFSENTFYYESRFYVPVIEFFEYLGFKVYQTEKQITVVNAKRPPPGKYKSKKSQKVIFSSEIDSIRAPDTFRLPHFEKDRQLNIAFNLKKHKIDRLFFYKDNHLFIALDTALKNEGFKVIRKDNAITISKGIKSVTFSLTSRQVSVSIDKKFTTQQLVHPVIKKSKRYYYPLTSFVSAFDYDIDWDAKDRIISLLSKVQQFKVIKSGKYPKLSIQLSNPVDSLQLHTLPIPNTYKVDIPFSKSRLDKSFYFLHSNPVVQLSALDSHKTTQIQFLMKTKTLHPSIAKTKTGFDIQFYPVIKTLKESSDPYNLDLKIKIGRAHV